MNVWVKAVFLKKKGFKKCHDFNNKKFKLYKKNVEKKVDQCFLRLFYDKKYILNIGISCFETPLEWPNNPGQEQKVAVIILLSHLF